MATAQEESSGKPAAKSASALENALNAPSMWYFTMHFTLAPALIVALVYVFLATVIPAVALHFFNNGTVVERLRTAE